MASTATHPMHAKDWRVAVDAEMLGACGEEVLDLTKSLALGRFSTQGLLDGVPQHVLSAKEALRQRSFSKGNGQLLQKPRVKLGISALQ